MYIASVYSVVKYGNGLPYVNTGFARKFINTLALSTKTVSIFEFNLFVNTSIITCKYAQKDLKLEMFH